MDQIALGHSDCRIFKLTNLLIRKNMKNDTLVLCISIQIYGNLKLIEKFFGWV